MELYVLRHGKAEVSPSPGREDAGRPLTRQGREEIQRIAAWMLRNRCRFDLIATSPLRRAEETSDIVAEAYNLEKRLVVWEDLSPGMNFDRLMEQIASCDDLSSLLLIGHEPSLSGCIGRIISAGGGAEITLKKGGLARIRNFCPDPASGTLVWLLSPRHMRQ
jgi:phosphohistidine phosphatase